MSGFQLRVNGIHSAWMAEFGHACAHCDHLRDHDPYRMANVSYSVVQRDAAGGLLRHTLIDAGLGVMQSLLDFERTHGVHVVHEVLLSHSHFDHVGHLDWLAQATGRNGRADQPRPVEVYCTQACWDTGPGRLFPWLARGEGDAGKAGLRHRAVVPGEAIALGGLRVTPMAVEHGPTAPGAVGFVVEAGGDGDAAAPGGDTGERPAAHRAGLRKVVLTCDMLHPADADDPRWFDADVCFIESNTWNPNPHTGHQSILEALALLRRWRPRVSYLIHYSGFEDADHPGAEVSGPMTPEELQRVVRRHAGELDVRVAEHGMILGEVMRDE